jgi:hypothetical protein
MAAPLAEVSTPKKTYYGGNSCVICGFVFEQHITNSDNSISVVKFTDRKLKLTNERRIKIVNVIGEINVDEIPAGVCQKCFRTVERVSKNENEILKTKRELKDSYNRTLASRLSSLPSGVTKRMLRSPISQPPKRNTERYDRSMLLPINIIQPVRILPFTDLTNVGNKSQGNSDQGVGEMTSKTRRSLGASFQQQQVLKT